MNSKSHIMLIIATTLLIFLTDCGVNILIPDMQLVQKAIALEITLSQQQLNQQLFGSEHSIPQFKINRVTVAEIETLEIQNLPSYKVRGSYNLIIKLPDRKFKQQKNSFQIYLQSQKERKTWRLARQQPNNNSGITWLTYVID